MPAQTTFNDTYEIRSIIGKGGMSTVYVAEHKRLHTRWAVKEVRKAQGVRFDFLAESNILKRLQHPMLPRIVDIFEDSQNIYIVEDFVEGITLDEYIKRGGRADEANGLQWFQDLCTVLQYLHNQKPNPIIYRDMKPSNIMLQPDGTLKLIDFGIAREYKQDANADTTYVGTKGYAAPEQFGKAQTDARTDIYSLGVTMYHLLTGKSPYEPPYEFVPARELVKDLSHGAEYILAKCVRLEPQARYQSVDELIFDLNHIYRFDAAYKRYVNAKRLRAAIIAVMLAASVSMIAGGRAMMTREAQQALMLQRQNEEMERLQQEQEREDRYASHMEEALACLDAADYEEAIHALDEAEAIFPERVDSYRQHAYTLYRSGAFQDCADYAEEVLDRFPEDGQTLLTAASASFELGDYERAAEEFQNGARLFDMNADNLRDYAVCLGRMGDVEGAEEVLNQLAGLGTQPEATAYVQGEVAYAQGDYLAAETAFRSVLADAAEEMLIRRCYISLGDLYRDCTALARTGNSPIETPASKAVEVLSRGIMENALRYDTVLWEMLGMAYFESYHTDNSVPRDYLQKAGECFERVIELGVTKDYLYSNLYTIYYEQGDYERAGQALSSYEAMFPQDYMPHALRGILYITLENQKPEGQRNFNQALAEYEAAGNLIRSEDNTVYYQQLESLIANLRNNGWL